MRRDRNTLYKSASAGAVRRQYIDLLRQGKPNGEAVNILLGDAAAQLEDAQYSKEFWLALADTMWQYGRLTEQVKINAQSVIDESREALLSLRDTCPRIYDARTRLLDQVEEKLHTPQPVQKRIPAQPRFENDWAVGDVLAFRLSEEAQEYAGQFVCVQVVRKQRYGPGHLVPVIRVFHGTFAEKPALDTLANMRCLPQFWGPNAYDRRLDGASPYAIRRYDVLYNMLLSAANGLEYRAFEYMGRLPVAALKLDRTEDANESICRLFEVETVSALRKWEGADVYALLEGT